MKSFKMLLMAVFSIVTVSAFSQDSTHKKMHLKEHQSEGMYMYACPMKCEGDKTYDKAGKCPSCGMDLKEKVKSAVQYSCPMKCEGDKTHDKPGSCSKCGMDLTKVKTKTKKD